jgi:hypothetical protein
MLLDLVLWSFMIVFALLALGLAWQQTAAVVQQPRTNRHPDPATHGEHRT